MGPRNTPNSCHGVFPDVVVLPPVDDEPDEELDVKSNADPDGNVLYYS
jgi:hypothetical protein